MGSSGVEDARALYAPAYTRDTGKITRGLRSVVKVVYVCRQRAEVGEVVDVVEVIDVKRPRSPG
jgi:hypothetical protein